MKRSYSGEMVEPLETAGGLLFTKFVFGRSEGPSANYSVSTYAAKQLLDEIVEGEGFARARASSEKQKRRGVLTHSRQAIE